MSINVIEHLARTVSPAILGDNADDNARNALLKKAYAIFISHFMDKAICADLKNATPSNNFFERLLPQAKQRNDLITHLSQEFALSNDETLQLVSDSAPLAFSEVQNLAGTTPVADFLCANVNPVANMNPVAAPSLHITPITANQTATHTDTPKLAVTETTAPVGNLAKWLLPVIALLILSVLAAVLFH
ncbi:OmpA family outer membrane protein [Moraxella macacae 0408225]|uniref:OmpA family outer membrane protein n=1 Tax=Moraxella macacae 0408225 TaxID=1230338 RepID=L2FA82_9GAMM|nr:hypothetical protein [Moraxella macacae]ELA09378.1 OmpA family outer membrane protein [Moraxella macacae 0408225]